MIVEFEVMELNENLFYNRIEKLKKMADNREFEFKLDKGETYTKKIELDIEGYLHKLQVEITPYTLDIGIPEESNRYMEVGEMRKIDERNILDVDPMFEENYEVSSLPEQLYYEPILCEHCGSGRPCKKTHVLYDFYEQEFFQVASGCLYEYRLHMRPLKIESILKELEYTMHKHATSSLSRHREHYTYEEFKPVALYSLSHYMGLDELQYISRSQAYYNKLVATEELINQVIFEDKGVSEEVEDEYPLFLNYLTSELGDAENKNFENMIADNTLPSFRRRGLLYLAFKYLYDKEKRERKALEKNLMDAEVSDYIGEKGDKLELPVTYVKSISFDTDFGVGYYHFFSTEEGNVLKWSTSKGFNENMVEGDNVEIKFKIKGHESYRGLKQTQIFYVKIL
ncbi:hypothetical protein P9X10_01535 [Bacillus cereus]|nr:hypothetical protein [Bacillus cereus]